MKKVMFYDVLNEGNLFFEFSLFEFEGKQILFICKNKHNQMFFCLCNDAYKNGYLICKPNKKDLEQAINDDISVYDLLQKSNNIIVAKTKNDHMVYEKIPFQSIEQDELPNENEKIECENDIKERILYDLNECVFNNLSYQKIISKNGSNIYVDIVNIPSESPSFDNKNFENSNYLN